MGISSPIPLQLTNSIELLFLKLLMMLGLFLIP